MRIRHLFAGLLLGAVTATVLSPAAPAAASEWRGDGDVRVAVNTSTTADLDAYWTPERIANAKPVPTPDVAPSGDRPQTTVGDPVTVPGSAPTIGRPGVTGVAETEGRLLFSADGGDWLCSATVIAGENRSVIATARHCGFESGGTNYRFAPNYDNGHAPHGWWDWRSAGWVTGGDGITNDFAFIVLNTQDGRYVTDVVGSSGLAFNQGTDHWVHIVGIPGATDAVTYCEGQAYGGPAGQQLLDDCDGMSGGASGGAWVINWQPDGSAYQVGTYFGSYGDAAAGSYFGDAAYGVWDAAQHA